MSDCVFASCVYLRDDLAMCFMSLSRADAYFEDHQLVCVNIPYGGWNDLVIETRRERGLTIYEAISVCDMWCGTNEWRR